ncbi:membrane protein [Marinomonas posidonica]|uniref:Membrane protein n=1 Tax=Marinomonas posidonica (strain CECT 7376 / NCIMB 14433 / IVIA-Po-181) TaxID=491952 RepID=F6CZV4_MARPP|nr:membrane protein [Marinomonas posidonica]AEF53615.1 membrane protein [Marinomonas posidonica IVIA-Po-181]
MVLKVVLLLLIITYPFFVYWADITIGSAFILPILAVVLLLRFVQTSSLGTRSGILLITITMLLSLIYFGPELSVKLYPVLVNISLFCIFTGSLFTKQSIVERMARIQEPSLPSSAIRYTRNVTKVWAAFFMLNGSISLGTVQWASTEIWTFYNGFLAYILIAAIAGIEWFTRKKVKAKV